MDYLYSLYDALTSINVPNDKARAVVDAMERDMGTTIATKTDLQMMSAASKADLQQATAALRAEMQQFSVTMKADIHLLRQEMATKAEVAEVRHECALIRKDVEILSGKIDAIAKDITVRLGSAMVGLMLVLFGALKLT